MTSLRQGLGRAVAQLRKGAGYSQEAFAHKCGVHRTYMTGIERGRHNVSLDILERIAKGLKIDTGQLMTEAERERRGPVKEPQSDDAPRSVPTRQRGRS